MAPGPLAAAPAWLTELLAEGETWLMERVLSHAKAQGYAAFTSTLVEPWRISVAGLTRAIAATAADHAGLPRDYPAQAPAGADPIAAFAVLEAGRHRARGVSLGMFWGLLKYYLRAYQEYLDERLAGDDRRPWARQFVTECFERMEFAFVVAWNERSDQERHEELARENLRLANEKNRYLTVLESIPQALFLLDAAGVVTDGNAAGLALAGHDAPPGTVAYAGRECGLGSGGCELLGRGLESVLPWLGSALALADAAADGTAGLECALERDGEERRLAVRIDPMRDVSGKFAGRVVQCRDVTAARRAEAALRQSEERYRTLVDLMHQGLVILSPGGRIDFVNDALCAMLGAPREGVVGRDMAAFVRPEDRDRFQTALRAHGQGVAEAYELRLRRADDGRLVQVMASPSPLIGQDGEYQGSLELFTDVTRLRELEMRLVTAKRLEAIGQLAGGVAHEINTPLQYVTGNLDFALSNLPRLVTLIDKYERALVLAEGGTELARARADIEAYRREHDLEMVLAELPLALSESHDGAERVAAFVRSIKRFARAETGGRRNIDVAEAVAATVAVARGAIAEAIALEVLVDENLPPVPCVPGDFNQVLLCLLHNAARAAAQTQACGAGPGRVAVRARRDGRYLEVAVSDNGPGIPPEIQDKIFNPFFTTKDVGQGMGQGLSIALSIMEKHGGTIRFETDAGRGTTFYLTFPLE